MKLRNKKTGKIVEWFNNTDGMLPNSLAELNEEWEDYVEPALDVQGATDAEVSRNAEWFIRTLFGGNVMLEDDDSGGEE